MLQSSIAPHLFILSAILPGQKFSPRSCAHFSLGLKRANGALPRASPFGPSLPFRCRRRCALPRQSRTCHALRQCKGYQWYVLIRGWVISPYVSCTEMGKITCKMISIKDQDQLCQGSKIKDHFSRNDQRSKIRSFQKITYYINIDVV